MRNCKDNVSTCTLCCGACKHCTEEGCGIYENRPEMCRQFECLWKSQPFPIPINLKPNKCGAFMIFGADGAVCVNADHEDVYNYLTSSIPVNIFPFIYISISNLVKFLKFELPNIFSKLYESRKDWPNVFITYLKTWKIL